MHDRETVNIPQTDYTIVTGRSKMLPTRGHSCYIFVMTVQPLGIVKNGG